MRGGEKGQGHVAYFRYHPGVARSCCITLHRRLLLASCAGLVCDRGLTLGDLIGVLNEVSGREGTTARTRGCTKVFLSQSGREVHCVCAIGLARFSAQRVPHLCLWRLTVHAVAPSTPRPPQFFSRLGLRKLRFKPAFNPYTEPSMEIFRCGAAGRQHATCRAFLTGRLGATHLQFLDSPQACLVLYALTLCCCCSQLL